MLTDACEAAGLGPVDLVPESVVAATPPWVQFLVIFLAGATISPLLLAAAPINVIVWLVRRRRRG